MPEEFNLLYKPGQLLNDKYIYLYNLGYKIYGLYLFEKRDKKPKFIRIREADIEVTGCLTLRETKIIVNKFIKSKVDPHHLLDKYFKILVINE